MKAKPLPSQEELKRLFDYDSDAGVLRWRVSSSPKVKVGDIAGRKNKGYIGVMISRKEYQAHRIAWKIVYGEDPEEIDHINGVKHDNRIDNLRSCTRSQNAMNRGARRGVKGVHWSKSSSKWRAAIQINGKRKHIGLFNCIKEAERAYKEAAEKHHGEFAYHNREGE